MKFTFRHIGNDAQTYVVLGNAGGATPLSIFFEKHETREIHLDSGQRGNLKVLVAENPEFFENEITVTPLP